MKLSHLVGSLALSVLAGLSLGTAHAQGQADCAISYTRTACPGKQAESFSKCDGKASCVKPVEAATPQACQAAALKACANDRFDITKSKVITATYKGAPVKSASGKDDFCMDYDKRAAEFDRCGN